MRFSIWCGATSSKICLATNALHMYEWIIFLQIIRFILKLCQKNFRSIRSISPMKIHHPEGIFEITVSNIFRWIGDGVEYFSEISIFILLWIAADHKHRDRHKFFAQNVVNVDHHFVHDGHRTANRNQQKHQKTLENPNCSHFCAFMLIPPTTRERLKQNLEINFKNEMETSRCV